MPHYSYRCPNCGDFVVEQRITADKLKDCPTCGKPVQRIIGKNINVLYKTTGFYCTDSGSCGSCDSCK